MTTKPSQHFMKQHFSVLPTQESFINKPLPGPHHRESHCIGPEWDLATLGFFVFFSFVFSTGI